VIGKFAEFVSLFSFVTADSDVFKNPSRHMHRTLWSIAAVFQDQFFKPEEREKKN